MDSILKPLSLCGSLTPIRGWSGESFGHAQSITRETAKWINKLERTAGRQVWRNFWDTRLSFEKSYLAWLNYVHQNPVKHGLVAVANKYPWCPAAWFERTARPAQVKNIYAFKLDKVHVYDEYEASPEW